MKFLLCILLCILLLSACTEDLVLPVCPFTQVTYKGDKLGVVINSDAMLATLECQGRVTYVPHNTFGCITIPAGDWTITVNNKTYQLQ